MICVYSYDCTDFSNNGLGAVLPQSCTVTETLNGEWEVTLVHPIDADGKWKRLVEGYILRIPVPTASTPRTKMVQVQYVYKLTSKAALYNGTGKKKKSLGTYKKNTEVYVIAQTNETWYEVACTDGKKGFMEAKKLEFVRSDSTTSSGVVASQQLRDQPFRIYRIVPELTKITVYARHIFYDLLDNMIQSYTGTNLAGSTVVQGISDACLSEHEFTFYSDVTDLMDEFEFTNTNPVEALMGDEGVIGLTGCELARDWFDVYVVNRVGNDTNVQIREGKNLTGITYDIDLTNVVTRIMPVGEDEDGEPLYLPEVYIDSPNIESYQAPKWYCLECSDAKEVKSGDDKKTKEQCYTEMREAAQRELDNGCDQPDVTLKVNFINCADTEEYKDYKLLKNIFLGDAVTVKVKTLGIAVSMRMTEYTYDCLTRQYTEMTLGNSQEALEGNTISSKQIPSGSITSAKLSSNSVGTANLKAASVTSRKIEAEAITTELLAAETVTADKLAASSVTTSKIDAGAVTAEQIATGTITAKQIEAGTITGNEIASQTITAVNIAGKTITADQLMAELITADCGLIATGAIQTAQIADGSITDAKIVSLNADVITSGTIKAERLLLTGTDGLIYEINATSSGLSKTELAKEDYRKYLNGTVIVAKSLTAAQIAAATITGNEIAANTIKAANIDVSSLFANEEFVNSLYVSNIYGGQSIKIMAGNIESVESAAQAAKDAAAAAQETVDNIAVGGRNLLRNSGASLYGGSDYTIGRWRVAGNNVMARSHVDISAPPANCEGVTGALQAVGAHPTTVWDGECFCIDNFPYFGAADREVTLSAWARVVGGGENCYFGFATSTNIFSNGTVLNAYHCQPLDSNGAWTRVVIHGKTVSAAQSIYCGFLTGDDTVTVQVCAMKFELGNIATDWTPAPEDVSVSISTAQAAANTAQSTADSAVSTANTAKSTADAASTTATNAKSTADSAASTASSAKTTADSAASTANTAKSTAETAKTNAASAVSTANTAKTTADNAATTASNAQTTANTAKNTADSAASTANTAKSTAETAKTNAASAVSTANTAKSTADAASTTANTAKSTADSAASTANTAKSTADAAQTTANTAKSTADSAATAASNAQTTANEAKALGFVTADAPPTSAPEAGYRWLDTGTTPNQMRLWRGCTTTPAGETLTTARSFTEEMEATLNDSGQSVITIDNADGLIISNISVRLTDTSLTTGIITVNGTDTAFSLTDGVGKTSFAADAGASYTIVSSSTITASYACSGWATMNDTTNIEEKVEEAYSKTQYMEIRADGTHLKAMNTANEMVLTNEGLHIDVNGQTYSQFAANYVQFGNYQLYRTIADGGLAFKVKW